MLHRVLNPHSIFVCTGERTFLMMNTSLMNMTSQDTENGHMKTIVLPIGLLALMENFLIIVMVLKIGKLRRRPHVFFVLCLSFSDLLFSVAIIWLSIMPYIFEKYHRSICCCQHVMLHISFATSLMVTLIICLERFRSIRENMLAITYFNSKKYYLIVSTWIVSIFYMTVLFLAVPQNQEISMITAKCRLDSLYTNGYKQIVYASLSALYLPLVVLILVFYTVTAIKIRRRFTRTYFVNDETDMSSTSSAAITSGNAEASFSGERCDRLGFNKPTTVDGRRKRLHFSRTKREFQLRTTQKCFNVPVKTMPMRMSNNTTFVSAFRSRYIKRALWTVTLIVLSYVICLGPIIIEFFVRCFSFVNVHVSSITNILACLNAVMNPVLYIWRLTDLRKEMKIECSKLR